MQSLADKVVIITGASEGIGAQLVLALRARQAKLVLNARDEPRLRNVAADSDLIIQGDLTFAETRAEIIESAVARFGRIDVLINNAGRGSYFSVSEAPLKETRDLFELNFFAPFHLAQLATPYLKASQGTLANISSIAGQITLPWLPLYSASKFALTSLTTSQRMELSRHGVNVMAVYPGYVDTDFQAHAAGGPPPDRVVRGKRFAVSAAKCAAAIVYGIQMRKPAVITPRAGRALVWLNRLFPRLVESRMEAV